MQSYRCKFGHAIPPKREHIHIYTHFKRFTHSLRAVYAGARESELVPFRHRLFCFLAGASAELASDVLWKCAGQDVNTETSAAKRKI